MKHLLLLLIVLFGLDISYGQDCSLQGTVTDALSGSLLLFATVRIYQNDLLLTATETDLDGKYCIPDLELGLYEVEVYYVGYATATNSVNLCIETEHNISLSEGTYIFCGIVIPYDPPIIDLHNTSWTRTFTAKGILRSPK